MQIILSIFFLLMLTRLQALAEPFIKPIISGPSPYLISIKYIGNTTKLYVKNYQYKKSLFYKANFIYSAGDAVDVEQDGDIVSLVFTCGNNDNICSRFFNRRTNEFSAIYTDLIAYNNSNSVGAYYLKSKQQLVIKPMFGTCKKPLILSFKIYPDSDFGIKTDLKQNGNLILDYADPVTSDDAMKTIHINFAKLLADCKSG